MDAAKIPVVLTEVVKVLTDVWMKVEENKLQQPA